MKNKTAKWKRNVNKRKIRLPIHFIKLRYWKKHLIFSNNVGQRTYIEPPSIVHPLNPKVFTVGDVLQLQCTGKEDYRAESEVYVIRCMLVYKCMFSTIFISHTIVQRNDQLQFLLLTWCLSLSFFYLHTKNVRFSLVIYRRSIVDLLLSDVIFSG